jgi:hypothetical protein
MKTRIICSIAAAMFCLSTIVAAEPTPGVEQGNTQKKQKVKAGDGTAAQRSTRNQGKLTVGVDDAHAKKVDSQGTITGTDGGVGRSGENKKIEKKQVRFDGTSTGAGKKISAPLTNTHTIGTTKPTATPAPATTQTTTVVGGSQSSGSAQPANTIQTTTTAGGSQSSGSTQPTTIQTTTAVGASQSSGSAQPTIPLGGQTGAPAPNTNAQTLGGLIQINPSPTP